MTTLEDTPIDSQEILAVPTPVDLLAGDVPADENEITEDQSRTTRLNALAAQARQGDMAAFGTLYAETSKELEAFLRTRTDPYTAQDIVQTTFVKAFEKLDTFNGGSVRSWLYTIAIRSHFDLLRRDKHITFLDADTAFEGQPGSSDTEATASSRVAAHELFAQSELNEDQATIVWLVRVLGMSFREAAEIQGINEVTARTRTFRAEKSLREQYPVA